MSSRVGCQEVENYIYIYKTEVFLFIGMPVYVFVPYYENDRLIQDFLKIWKMASLHMLVLVTLSARYERNVGLVIYCYFIGSCISWTDRSLGIDKNGFLEAKMVPR